MISDPAVFVEEWQQLSLPGPAEKLSVPALDPARTALLVIDLNRGFAEKGALYSPLSRALLPGVAELLADFREKGIQALLFTDTHSPDSPEFLSYPPHCVKGTGEEEVCPELLAVQWGTVLPKNSTNACLEPVFLTWLEEHDAVDTWVLYGYLRTAGGFNAENLDEPAEPEQPGHRAAGSRRDVRRAQSPGGAVWGNGSAEYGPKRGGNPGVGQSIRESSFFPAVFAGNAEEGKDKNGSC